MNRKIDLGDFIFSFIINFIVNFIFNFVFILEIKDNPRKGLKKNQWNFPLGA